MKLSTLILSSIILLQFSCAPNPKIDQANIVQEVTKEEMKLMDLLKRGEIDSAFAIHDNSASYRNIVEGVSRNYHEMDSVLKAKIALNVKAYEYLIFLRDFYVINETTVLETIHAKRKTIHASDSILENRPTIISILWVKKNGSWKDAYSHGSYKLEKNPELMEESLSK